MEASLLLACMESALDTSEIRRIFVDFYAQRGHSVVESSSLIPNDPSLLLTAAGMVQFKPYLLSLEEPPYRRATSVQKCARTTDIDIVGTTLRHLTFFEMLGNFSLGDYFKADAIPWAWELVTEGFGFDPDHLWVTVHESDDEAAQIWLDTVGIDPGRLQRLGSDNFWSMGAAGPCGPCSEIFVDKGDAYGEAGGPAVNDERYVEIYNLVFMQYEQDDDGNVVGDLPNKSIDTGAGLERIAAVRNGLESVFDCDTIRPVLGVAEALSGRTYGEDAAADISLRILADHGRSATFLVTDGVFPSNEERGYVLRRILRRAVLHAFLLGSERDVLVPLAESVIEIFADIYPELARGAETTKSILANEEERFRATLKSGMVLLENALGELDPGERLPGEIAFKLHDTHGFPIELTQEISATRQVEVDLDAFGAAMQAQRERSAGDAHAAGEPGAAEPGTEVEVYRGIVDELGRSEFLGYETMNTEATIGAIVAGGRRVETAGEGDEVEVFAAATPFYAEAGGQVGDSGLVVVASAGNGDGRALLEVTDTQYAIPGLISHHARVARGVVSAGQAAEFCVDVERRSQIRKHHTGTHLLHWALREVLGEHVRQQGSIVLPDRLRFDFSHYAAVTPDELAQVEALANREMLSNAAVKNYETSKAEADDIGVLSFFGEKYGERVRVLEAGAYSKELCGGTHVSSLGEIGPIVIVSESSIGSNIRRIEALCGEAALDYLQSQRAALSGAAGLLHAAPGDVPGAVEKRLEELAAARKEIEALRSQLAAGQAGDLAAQTFDLAGGGRGVVARVEGVDSPKDLQRLAGEVRGKLASAVVVLGAEVAAKASLVSAVSKDLQTQGLSAAETVREAAGLVGGGTGKNPDVAMAGGPRGDQIDSALEAARSYLDAWSPSGNADA